MRVLFCLAVFAGLLCAALAGISNAKATTLIVTTTADSGPGSLRQALADAQDGDTIQFDPALNGQSILLTTAELVISKNITINGPGPDLLSVSRSPTAPQFRVFHIFPGHTVAIQGITISGGNVSSSFASGGGVFNDQATLAIDHCTVSNNRGGYTGGGIYNTGPLEIVDSTISSNSALASAGGIYHSGTTTITHSTISQNSALNRAGGIYSGGNLTITDSTVSSNHVGTNFLDYGDGGGIFHDGSGTLTILNSTISNNTADGGP